MSLKTFVTDLMNKYTIYFNVYREEQIEDIPLAFIAQHHRRDERYMITKKIKVYGVENQTIVIGAVQEKGITEKFVKRFQTAIENNIGKYIPEHNEHMSTIVLGLMITEEDIDPQIEKGVKSFRKIKFLRFGLHGWAEMYLAIINPRKKSIVIHSKGRPFVLSIEKMLEEEEKIK